MKKRVLTLALALVLCVGLALPATAAAEDGITITWLPEGEGDYCEYYNYNRELHYVTVESDESDYVLNLKTGEIIDEFNYMWSFSDGLAMVRKGDFETGKYGFIDKTGEVVVPLEYDDAQNFSEGLAVVEKDGKWGYIDKTGKVVVPLGEYDYAYPFSEGLAEVR